MHVALAVTLRLQTAGPRAGQSRPPLPALQALAWTVRDQEGGGGAALIRGTSYVTWLPNFAAHRLSLIMPFLGGALPLGVSTQFLSFLGTALFPRCISVGFPV